MNIVEDTVFGGKCADPVAMREKTRLARERRHEARQARKRANP